MAGTDKKIFYGLIGLNVAVFALVRIVAALGGDALAWLALPAGWAAWVHRPWTSVTYMFTQYDILHLVFNMLWLWTFYVAQRHLAIGGPRYLLPKAYAVGGLLTGIVFVSAGTGVLVGSSASVLAYAAAVATLGRKKSVTLALFGRVPLSVLTAVVIALVLVGAPSPVSHAVGAVGGIALALMPRIVRTLTPRGRLDSLERRVRRDGFGSLSPTERSELFYLSQRYKK